jgi:flagellar hook-length control protein FliK
MSLAKLMGQFQSAPADLKSTSSGTGQSTHGKQVNPYVASEFTTMLTASRARIQALHEATAQRAAKAKPPIGHPERPPQHPVERDASTEEPVDASQEAHSDDSDAATPVAEQKATSKDEAADTANEAKSPESPLPADPTNVPVEAITQAAAQTAVQSAAQNTAQTATSTAAETVVIASNANGSEMPAQSPTSTSAKSAANKAATIVQADPKSAAQGATADSTDEKADPSTPSQEASTLPPTLAAGGRKQAHENRDHAAHIGAMEADASSEKAAAAQMSPPPTEVGAGTDLGVALSDETTLAASTKEPSAKPAEAAGSPVVLGETTRSLQEVKGAELAPAAQESPGMQDADTMDQIVLGLKGKLDARTGKAEIRLDPPNLGTMKVSVTLESGILSAEFQSPSPVVRDLLQGNLEKLKTVLQGQGVAVDRLVVNAPADTGTSGQNPQASFGSATHDGRSAGQQQQDARSNNGRSGEGFARAFNEAQEAPLDLVA